MANVMQPKNLKNKVNRSGFDLSMRNMCSTRTGEIMPIAWFETLPGDDFNIKFSSFTRTIPLITANFARLRQYCDAYFIPYRLIWDKFSSWISQTKNSYQARSILDGATSFDGQPYFTQQNLISYVQSLSDSDKNEANQGQQSSCIRLLNNLGYCIPEDIDFREITAGQDVWNQRLNPFPLLAYQKIYQDYFRFGQWEDAAPWTYNLDYIMQNSQLEIDLQTLSSDRNHINMMQMRYCNLDKDLFNGLLPNAQFGDEAIASPIVGTLAGNLIIESDVDGGASGANYPNIVFNYHDEKMSVQGNSSGNITRLSNNYAHLNAIANQHNSAGISVLAIRMAEQLQKWKEITQSGSPDYKEQLEKHWNVRVSDLLSDRCVYLGGVGENLNINEVVNQNLTGDSVADLKGKGSLSSGGSIRYDSDKFGNEYGIIIIVAHTKPVIEWVNNQILHPALLRYKPTDYAIPEFDSIGMQSVSTNILPWNGIFSDNYFTPAPVKTLGFAPRYIEYKTNYDRLNGYFATENGKAWVLAHNPITEYLNDKGTINANSFRVRPEISDNLFVAKTESDFTPYADPYHHSFMIDCKAVRNLSYDGLPY